MVTRLPIRSRKRHHSSKGDASRRKGGGERERDLDPVPPLMYIASAETAGRQAGMAWHVPSTFEEEKGEWPVYQSDSRVAKRVL